MRMTRAERLGARMPGMIYNQELLLRHTHRVVPARLLDDEAQVDEFMEIHVCLLS